MASQHLHRLILIIPAARREAINRFFAEHLDEGGDAFTVGLNPTGDVLAPPTHYINNRSYTPAELKKLMTHLCGLARIPQPPTWDAMNRNARKQWLMNQRQAIRQATGIRFAVADNDGRWDDPQEMLAQAGLKTRQREIV